MNGILMNGHDTEKGLCDVRLLVVDDDAFSRKLMLEILRKRGICVDVAGNGAEAVEKIGRTDYAAVLMDCRMPVMDGFEATRKIRADRRFADLPILAMSGDATEDDVKKCLECGMNGCIAKPIDVGQLFTTLGCWVKLKTAAVAEPNDAVVHGDEAPNIAGLETDKALRHLGGNVDLLRKLIIRFGATQADTVARIRAAIESGDAETALRAAHTFKGVAGNIGATQMSACAAMVESMLKQGKADGLADALDEMEQELNLLRERIAAAMSGYEPPAGAAPGSFVDMAALAGELREFATLLATGDSRACKLVDGIAYRLGAVGQNIAAGQLKEFISQYDFKGALDKLKEAAQALEIAL
ncbi:MAG: response regulator [Gallionella sp.]|nr:response regulator [Gallionella sp.]